MADRKKKSSTPVFIMISGNGAAKLSQHPAKYRSITSAFTTEDLKKERPFTKKIQVALLEVSTTTASNQKGITRESEGGVSGLQHEGHAAIGMSWSRPRFLGSQKICASVGKNNYI